MSHKPHWSLCTHPVPRLRTLFPFGRSHSIISSLGNSGRLTYRKTRKKGGKNWQLKRHGTSRALQSCKCIPACWLVTPFGREPDFPLLACVAVAPCPDPTDPPRSPVVIIMHTIGYWGRSRYFHGQKTLKKDFCITKTTEPLMSNSWFQAIKKASTK